MALIGYLAVLPFFAPLPQATYRDGILNADFERELVTGTVGTSTDKPEGAFWCVSEEAIRDEMLPPMNRFLRLSGAQALQRIAYQRVAGVKGNDSAKITGARVRLVDDNDPATAEEARITFSEGTGRWWSLHWVLRNTSSFYWPDPDGDLDPGGNLIRWRAEDFVGGVKRDLERDAMNLRFDNDVTDNEITQSYIQLATTAGGWMQAIWVAPIDGRVRLMNRPYFIEEGSGDDVQYSVLVLRNQPMATPSVLASSVIDEADDNGPLMILHEEVKAGDEIWFRWEKPLATIGSPVLMGGMPVVLYEGNSYTYRIGVNLADDVADTATEKFEVVDISQLDQWQNLPDLFVGSDLHLAFCGGFCSEETIPPFDVKLTAQTGIALFDDIQCEVEWDDVSASELRDLIADELRWYRDIVTGQYAGTGDKGLLDNDTFGKKRGSTETNYRCHTLFLETGAQYDSGNTLSRLQGIPGDLWPMLDTTYDPTGIPDPSNEEKEDDYTQFYALVEPLYHPDNTSMADLVYPTYNVENDQIVTDPLLYPDGIEVTSEVDPGNEPSATAAYYKLLPVWFRRLNDPTFLDRAFDAAVAVGDNAVLDEPNPPAGWPDRTGFIAYRALSINTAGPPAGALADQFGPGGESNGLPDYHLIRNFDAVGPLLDIVVTARLFNLENPQLSPPRYDTTKLATLETKLSDAIEAAIPLRTPKENDLIGKWQYLGNATWQRHPGLFNDLMGHQGEALLDGYRLIKEYESAGGTLTTPLQDIKTDIEAHWLTDTVDCLYTDWEQIASRNEFMPGDHTRGWPMFVEVINDTNIAVNGDATRSDMERLVHESALYSLKFQYPGGAWASGGLGRFQLFDPASRQLGPVFNFVRGMGYAVETGFSKAEMQSYIAATLEATQEFHRAEFGYWTDFFDRPSGSLEFKTALRVSDTYIDALRAFGDDPYTAADPPIPTITPDSFSQSGLAYYKVELTWPTGQNCTNVKKEQFDDRTLVYKWSVDSITGAWVGEQVWPTITGNEHFGNVGCPNATTAYIETLIKQPLPNPGDRLKYTVVTWNEDGRWNHATSLQEN